MANIVYIPHGHKIGIHAQRSTNALFEHLDQAVAQGTPFPVVKFVDELTALRVVKERSPQSITMGRLVHGDDGLQGIETMEEGAIAERAQHIMQNVFDYFDHNPGLAQHIDYMELVNEPDPPNAHGYLMMGKLMKACVTLGRQQLPGVGWAIGSFNAGTPEYEEMEAFLESGVMSDAHHHGDVILAYHSGVLGDDPIDKWHGGPIPGAPEVPAGGGPLVGRIAYWAQLAGSEMIPAVATEFYYGGGYGDVEEIRRRAAWADEEMSKLWYVLAVLPFTHSPMGMWVGKQDYTPAYTQLLALAAAVGERENAAPDDQGGGVTEDTTEALEAFIWEQSTLRDTINTEAALQKTLFEAGHVPYSTEFRRRFGEDGKQYAIQTGVRWQDGKRVVAYCEVPRWHEVKLIEDVDD